MNAPLFNIRDLPGKSFLLSVIVHVSVFSIFIIVWPVLPEPHKPNIVFLGSILRTSDFLGQALPQTQPTGKNTERFSFSTPQKKLFESQPEKPAATKSYAPQQKRTIKSVYEESLPEDPGSASIPAQNTTIDTELEPYKPLRLRTHD